MTFDELRARHAWRPIANCPGRLVLVRGGGRPPSFEELTGIPPVRFHVAGARDEVLVAPLAGGGGVLSYARPDGSMVHTLNTADGLARKLAALGIQLGNQPQDGPSAA